MLKILFICTHNRCRSILAEAIANHVGEGMVVAVSGGSSPVGEVHPLTLKYLQNHLIPIAGLKSQSWDEFADFEPDYVITVCDKAAQEACPVWFGKATQIHWSLADPSAINDSNALEEAFNFTIGTLKYRIMQIRGWLENGETGPELTRKIAQLAD